MCYMYMCCIFLHYTPTHHVYVWNVLRYVFKPQCVHICYDIILIQFIHMYTTCLYGLHILCYMYFNLSIIPFHYKYRQQLITGKVIYTHAVVCLHVTTEDVLLTYSTLWILWYRNLTSRSLLYFFWMLITYVYSTVTWKGNDVYLRLRTQYVVLCV